MLADVNKLFVFRSLLKTSNNVLLLHLKPTFPSIIWIFTDCDCDGIETRLAFRIFSTLKTNDPSKKISPHYTIGRKEGGLAHLEVDLANCSLAGEPFDRISVALILSIDLDVKDLMDFGDWPSSGWEWVITNKIWENKLK